MERAARADWEQSRSEAPTKKARKWKQTGPSCINTKSEGSLSLTLLKINTNPPLSTPTKRSLVMATSVSSFFVRNPPFARIVAKAEQHTNADELDTPAPYRK